MSNNLDDSKIFETIKDMMYSAVEGISNLFPNPGLLIQSDPFILIGIALSGYIYWDESSKKEEFNE